MIIRLKRILNFLKNPEKEFLNIKSKKLDPLLGDYLSVLLLISLFSGIVSFIFSIVKSFYYDSFFNADINYLRVLNYSLGISVSLFFLYIFLGTVIIFFLSVILRTLFKLPLKLVIKIVVFSATPMLLFSWIPKLGLALVVWSIYLVVLGLKVNISR